MSEIEDMLQYICRRCRDIGPFFWKIPQYLGSRWHNWSPNVATVTGWTKCLTEEVPLYKQSSLDQEQCWFTRDCLVPTALGNLLIFPIDMYLTCVTVSVFYSQSPWRVFCHWFGGGLKVTQLLSCRVCVLQNVFHYTKSLLVDRGFVIERRNIVNSSCYTY